MSFCNSMKDCLFVGSNLSARISALTNRSVRSLLGASPSIANDDLVSFTKETKSSFAIEGEAPSKDRTERFVSALMRADKFDPTNKQSFIELQNDIVDLRYAQKD